MNANNADSAMPLAPSTLDTPALLSILKSWSERGWLRRLDAAMGRFMVDLSPGVPPVVVMAATLTTHMEGRGHVCLQLADLLKDSNGLLGWGLEAAAELDAVMGALPRDVAEWVDALRSTPLVEVYARANADAPREKNQPLVLCDHAVYLRRYWDYEHRVAVQVTSRSEMPAALDSSIVRPWLDRLFPAPPRASEGDAAPPLDWQKIACAVALCGHFSIITGGPGTGKTYTAARLLALLFATHPDPTQLRVALAAPTGKAAARLKQSIEVSLVEVQTRLGSHLALGDLTSHIGAARTLHSLLGARPDTRAFRFNASHPLEVDVLIVDEASMIHLEMMAALLEALPPRARVIFLGDKDQLASVEAGAVLGDLCRHSEQGLYSASTVQFIEAMTGERITAPYLGDGSRLEQQTVMLRESKRFGGTIGKLALATNAGDAAQAASLLRESGDPAVAWLDSGSPSAVVQLALNGRSGAVGGFGDYLAALRERPRDGDPQTHEAWVVKVLKAFERFRLLCAVREGDWGASGLNKAVERALVANGLLTRRGEWYEGRPIIVTRNDAELGVFNGDIGIAMQPSTQGTSMRCYFLDGEAMRSVGVTRLAHVETAFAMTVHKSQGSEFAHAVLVLPREPSQVLTRELVYTGITRAREAFTLVSGRSAAFSEALAHRTQRASGLIGRLVGPGSAPSA